MQFSNHATSPNPFVDQGPFNHSRYPTFLVPDGESQTDPTKKSISHKKKKNSKQFQDVVVPTFSEAEMMSLDNAIDDAVIEILQFQAALGDSDDVKEEPIKCQSMMSSSLEPLLPILEPRNKAKNKQPKISYAVGYKWMTKQANDIKKSNDPKKLYVSSSQFSIHTIMKSFLSRAIASKQSITDKLHRIYSVDKVCSETILQDKYKDLGVMVGKPQKNFVDKAIMVGSPNTHRDDISTMAGKSIFTKEADKVDKDTNTEGEFSLKSKKVQAKGPKSKRLVTNNAFLYNSSSQIFTIFQMTPKTDGHKVSLHDQSINDDHKQKEYCGEDQQKTQELKKHQDYHNHLGDGDFFNPSDFFNPIVITAYPVTNCIYKGFCGIEDKILSDTDDETSLNHEDEITNLDETVKTTQKPVSPQTTCLEIQEDVIDLIKKLPIKPVAPPIKKSPSKKGNTKPPDRSKPLIPGFEKDLKTKEIKGMKPSPYRRPTVRYDQFQARQSTISPIRESKLMGKICSARDNLSKYTVQSMDLLKPMIEGGKLPSITGLLDDYLVKSGEVLMSNENLMSVLMQQLCLNYELNRHLDATIKLINEGSKEYKLEHPDLQNLMREAEVVSKPADVKGKSLMKESRKILEDGQDKQRKRIVKHQSDKHEIVQFCKALRQLRNEDKGQEVIRTQDLTGKSSKSATEHMERKILGRLEKSRRLTKTPATIRSKFREEMMKSHLKLMARKLKEFGIIHIDALEDELDELVDNYYKAKSENTLPVDAFVNTSFPSCKISSELHDAKMERKPLNVQVILKEMTEMVKRNLKVAIDNQAPETSIQELSDIEAILAKHEENMKMLRVTRKVHNNLPVTSGFGHLQGNKPTHANSAIPLIHASEDLCLLKACQKSSKGFLQILDTKSLTSTSTVNSMATQMSEIFKEDTKESSKNSIHCSKSDRFVLRASLTASLNVHSISRLEEKQEENTSHGISSLETVEKTPVIPTELYEGTCVLRENQNVYTKEEETNTSEAPTVMKASDILSPADQEIHQKEESLIQGPKVRNEKNSLGVVPETESLDGGVIASTEGVKIERLEGIESLPQRGGERMICFDMIEPTEKDEGFSEQNTTPGQQSSDAQQKSAKQKIQKKQQGYTARYTKKRRNSCHNKHTKASSPLSLQSGGTGKEEDPTKDLTLTNSEIAYRMLEAKIDSLGIIEAPKNHDQNTGGQVKIAQIQNLTKTESESRNVTITKGTGISKDAGTAMDGTKAVIRKRHLERGKHKIDKLPQTLEEVQDSIGGRRLSGTNRDTTRDSNSKARTVFRESNPETKKRCFFSTSPIRNEEGKSCAVMDGIKAIVRRRRQDKTKPGDPKLMKTQEGVLEIQESTRKRPETDETVGLSKDQHETNNKNLLSVTSIDEEGKSCAVIGGLKAIVNRRHPEKTKPDDPRMFQTQEEVQESIGGCGGMEGTVSLDHGGIHTETKMHPIIEEANSCDAVDDTRAIERRHHCEKTKPKLEELEGTIRIVEEDSMEDSVDLTMEEILTEPATKKVSFFSATPINEEVKSRDVMDGLKVIARRRYHEKEDPNLPQTQVEGAIAPNSETKDSIGLSEEESSTELETTKKKHFFSITPIHEEAKSLMLENQLRSTIENLIRERVTSPIGKDASTSSLGVNKMNLVPAKTNGLGCIFAQAEKVNVFYNISPAEDTWPNRISYNMVEDVVNEENCYLTESLTIVKRTKIDGISKKSDVFPGSSEEKILKEGMDSHKNRLEVKPTEDKKDREDHRELKNRHLYKELIDYRSAKLEEISKPAQVKIGTPRKNGTRRTNLPVPIPKRQGISNKTKKKNCLDPSSINSKPKDVHPQVKTQEKYSETHDIHVLANCIVEEEGEASETSSASDQSEISEDCAWTELVKVGANRKIKIYRIKDDGTTCIMKDFSNGRLRSAEDRSKMGMHRRNGEKRLLCLMEDHKGMKKPFWSQVDPLLYNPLSGNSAQSRRRNEAENQSLPSHSIERDERDSKTDGRIWNKIKDTAPSRIIVNGIHKIKVPYLSKFWRNDHCD